jgi:ubiquinone/menaquinone biosynthesis C-methylase UbiE
MAQQEHWQLADEAAENYERYRVPSMFGPLAEDLVEAAGLRPGDRVLDVACGTGVVARHAARQLGGGGRVAGLDINPGMLAVARAAAAAEGLAIEWREGDAQAVPFGDGSFDVVFCQQALQFFADRAAALREMRRVLAEGGRLALSVFRSIEHRPDLAAVAAALERHIGPGAGAARRAVVSLGDAGELRRLISGAGFRAVEIRPIVTTQRFASVEAYLREMETTAPSTDPVGRLDEPTRRAILADLSTALEPYLTGEALVFPAATHVATARK